MQGARLVNTPAMNSTGRAVRGLDESCAEICEKSTIARDAKEGCYFRASPFAMITACGASLFLRQQLLEQVECTRIPRLAEPEQSLLPDLGISVRFCDCGQCRHSLVARTLR